MPSIKFIRLDGKEEWPVHQPDGSFILPCESVSKIEDDSKSAVFTYHTGYRVEVSDDLYLLRDCDIRSFPDSEYSPYKVQIEPSTQEIIVTMSCTQEMLTATLLSVLEEARRRSKKWWKRDNDYNCYKGFGWMAEKMCETFEPPVDPMCMVVILTPVKPFMVTSEKEKTMSEKPAPRPRTRKKPAKARETQA